MLDELCRRLYWWVWVRLPSQEAMLARLTPEQRGMLEDMKRNLEKMTHG